MHHFDTSSDRKSPHPGLSEAKETQDGTMRDSVKQEQHH